MAFQRHMNIFFFFLLFSCFLFSSQASKFYVGGRDGWVLHPSENYTQWTQKNRFQVNDTLVFKYKKGSDSVLLVNKDDYYNCNTTNPIKKLEEGDSEYKLDKSGPSFFISGKEQNCEKGQKLIVTVLSVKHSNTSPPKTPTAPTQAPTPSSSHTPKVPPSLAPSSSSPGPSIAATPISLGPVTNTPVTSPSFSPLISPPSFSPLISPSSSPSFAPSFSPSSLSPASEAPSFAPEVPSPESNAPTEAPAYSPAYSSPPEPGTTPPSSPPSSSAKSPQSSPSPGSSTPGATPPAQSSAWAVTPTYVFVNLVGSVTILLSVSLGPVF
ncbi:early nodulin-like protein 2 [Quercus robur]|uniref:early nodulin-like protein 2 n=1 Tax=Quercus robur TaxID=38942 RepID=UPI002161E985|nr:early nodulin-like protein 2 [Quercus robur]